MKKKAPVLGLQPAFDLADYPGAKNCVVVPDVSLMDADAIMQTANENNGFYHVGSTKFYVFQLPGGGQVVKAEGQMREFIQNYWD